MDGRKKGKAKGKGIVPVAPNLSERSDTCLQFIEDIKEKIQRKI